MSGRKTKKQKQLMEKRIEIRNAQIKELEQLKVKVLQLESEISKQKKENFKQLNIRNLKVFANTCNFLMPFVISTGITVGAFGMFGGGLPFHQDEITKYKVYHLDFQTNDSVIMEEEYITDRWFDDELPSNTLVVYTPWKEKDGQYIRFKRDYDIENLTNLDLYNAVLDKDYQYISKNLKGYKEEKQIVNEITSEESDYYFFEVSLHMLDKEDILKYKETDFQNKVITIIELILGLGIGGLVAYFRRFRIVCELKYINTVYRKNISSIQSIKQELKDTNEKILSLTRMKGSKNNG